MKLYVFVAAPNPTRVRLYLAHKAAGGAKIDVEQVMVNLLEGEQRAPEHLERNEFGQLPVLEFDDGRFLTESLAIIEYFEETHPDPPMIGVGTRERARVRELERIAETGVLQPIALIVHTTNSPVGMPPTPEVAALMRERLPAKLAYLDGLLSDGRTYLAGDAPTIADCTLAAGLQFGRFGQTETDPRYEHLLRWDRDYRATEVARSVLVF